MKKVNRDIRYEMFYKKILIHFVQKTHCTLLFKMTNEWKGLVPRSSTYLKKLLPTQNVRLEFLSTIVLDVYKIVCFNHCQQLFF